MDARETGTPPATDGVLEAFLDSVSSPSGREFVKEHQRRRKLLRERTRRRFLRRAASVVALSVGGVIGIVAYGLGAGVP